MFGDGSGEVDGCSPCNRRVADLSPHLSACPWARQLTLVGFSWFLPAEWSTIIMIWWTRFFPSSRELIHETTLKNEDSCSQLQNDGVWVQPSLRLKKQLAVVFSYLSIFRFVRKYSTNPACWQKLLRCFSHVTVGLFVAIYYTAGANLCDCFYLNATNSKFIKQPVSMNAKTHRYHK